MTRGVVAVEAQAPRLQGAVTMAGMQVLWPALAIRLAERLAGLVPQAYTVAADDDAVRCGGPAGSERVDLDLRNPHAESAEDLEHAVTRVLDSVQDFIVEETTEVWPELEPGRMPVSFARIDGDLLRLGYSCGPDLIELDPLELGHITTA